MPKSEMKQTTFVLNGQHTVRHCAIDNHKNDLLGVSSIYVHILNMVQFEGNVTGTAIL